MVRIRELETPMQIDRTSVHQGFRVVGAGVNRRGILPSICGCAGGERGSIRWHYLGSVGGGVALADHGGGTWTLLAVTALRVQTFCCVRTFPGSYHLESAGVRPVVLDCSPPFATKLPPPTMP